MLAVNSRHLSKEEAKRLTFHPSLWPRYAFGLSLALILAVGTTGLAFASNNASPGDTLFPLQQLQNQLILALPLPQTKKEEIRTNIVAKRLQELDAVQSNPKASAAKVQATVEASKESVDDAVANLPKSSSSGQNDKINKLLDNLDDLSSQHEQQIQKIQAQVHDKVVQDNIESNLKDIMNAREKLKRARGDGNNSDGLPSGKNQNNSGSTSGSSNSNSGSNEQNGTNKDSSGKDDGVEQQIQENSNFKFQTPHVVVPPALPVGNEDSGSN